MTFKFIRKCENLEKSKPKIKKKNMENKKIIFTLIILLIITSVTCILAASGSFDLPAGWSRAGTLPKSYDMGIDKGAGQDGGNAATIQSIDKSIDGFGTLMQYTSAADFRGMRVKMSGYMKTKDVSDWAGFWLRVDQKGSEKSLAFDNMHDGIENRSITGTTDWKNYEIVLDIPVNADYLAFGALEVGTGQIWFDKIVFEIVDLSVPVTGNGKESVKFPEPANPFNLNFEEVAENQNVSDYSKDVSKFTIINNLNIPVSFYWTDFTGKSIFYFDLKPGEEHMQETFIGHVWIAKSKDDNKKLKEIKVDSPVQTWIIE